MEEERAGCVEGDVLEQPGRGGVGDPAAVSRRNGVRHLAVVDEPHTRAGGHLGALWVERVLVNRVPPAAQRPERILAERGGLDLVGLTRSWADPPHEI